MQSLESLAEWIDTLLTRAEGTAIQKARRIHSRS
jgi:hypothetical protein